MFATTPPTPTWPALERTRRDVAAAETEAGEEVTSDASLFRWRKDNVQGETSDLVTDADVLKRAADIIDREAAVAGTDAQGAYGITDIRWLASRLESEPSTDGDMEQP